MECFGIVVTHEKKGVLGRLTDKERHITRIKQMFSKYEIKRI